MDFREKARMQLEHWLTHNDHHEEEYRLFAEQLETAGMEESGRHVREMIVYTTKGTDALRKALATMEPVKK